MCACNVGVKEESVYLTSTYDQSSLVSSDATPSVLPMQTSENGDTSVTGGLASVGKWKRFEVSYSNLSWYGNPFDLEFEGVFTHVTSGRKVTQWGFYAGNNVWKIYFMPDASGEWTFETQSPDGDLNGRSGGFECVSSNLPGQLVADGNRWLLKDSGEYVAPILLPTREWFKRSKTSDGIDGFIKWADETAGALIIGTTLVYFNGAQDEIPYMKGEEGKLFNIPMWDRMNSHYDMMRDRGMGLYIMFYSDDEESPNRHNIKPKTKEELRLFKYAIARFSAYPIVMWDTGIDIGETRNNEWIDWFADWFNGNDPWEHPVSSRTGGGSGGKIPVNGTYFSNGVSTLPTNEDIINDWIRSEIPIAFTDRWRENYHRGEFNRDEIRRAVWVVGLLGGSALYVGGNENDGYLNENYAKDFEAATDLGFRNKFFREHIIDFSSLIPSNNLILAGEEIVLAADIGQEYVVYSYYGDTFSIDLDNVVGPLKAIWFNPRTGEWRDGKTVQGGEVQNFQTPTENDWVLHLFKADVDINNLWPYLFNVVIPQKKYMPK